MVSTRPRITLKAKRDASVRHGHPWIFSGAIADISGDVTDGTLVDVVAQSSDILGSGHYYTRDIAVRMLSRERIEDEAVWIEDSLKRAYALRESLNLVNNPHTTAYRLVNAEGDSLPGLVIDIYGETAVVQFQLQAPERCKDIVVEGLRALYGNHLCGIFEKKTGRQEFGEQGTYLWGSAGNPVIHEHGLKFNVDWHQGQKTGFFLDQRENRNLLREIAPGKRVLNAFCYTGGFSIAALAAGAIHVDSVDTSKPSLDLLSKNITLNSLMASHQTIAADCFSFLEDGSESYDIVVLDPPAFVKHRKSLETGLRAYQQLNHLALRRLRTPGWLMTFSCSQWVSREMFFAMLQRASMHLAKPPRVITVLNQSSCHPWSLQHQEGIYLKGFLLYVD